jgi:hypothetical protein
MGPKAGLVDVEKKKFLTSVVQLVARRYTDYAIPADNYNGTSGNMPLHRLTPPKSFHLEKLLTAQLQKKLPSFYGV